MSVMHPNVELIEFRRSVTELNEVAYEVKI